MSKYKVIRDSDEKIPWEFTNCVTAKLKTGDYTIEGYEELVTIERKGGIKEFAMNLCSKDLNRFLDELDRMITFKYAYVVLCFSFEDLLNYPDNSGIPYNVRKTMKIRGNIVVRKFLELQKKYPNITFVFAGNAEGGKAFARCVFSMVASNEKANNTDPRSD